MKAQKSDLQRLQSGGPFGASYSRTHLFKQRRGLELRVQSEVATSEPAELTIVLVVPNIGINTLYA